MGAGWSRQTLPSTTWLVEAQAVTPYHCRVEAQALGDAFQLCDLGRIGRRDDFPAILMGNAVQRGIFIKRAAAIDTDFRLK